MSFRLLPKSVTLNDLERRNGPYFCVISPNSVTSVAHCVKVVEYVVVKKFTFAISSPDEFLVYFLSNTSAKNYRNRIIYVTRFGVKRRFVLGCLRGLLLFVVRTDSVKGLNVCMIGGVLDSCSSSRLTHVWKSDVSPTTTEPGTR